MVLRPPQIRDFADWAKLRRESADFLKPWEPTWSRDHLTIRSFRNRVVWADRSIRQGEAVPLLLSLRDTGALVGGITLSNIRRQPAETATIGYWVGQHHAGQGYMTEALDAVRQYAFQTLGLSRLEAGCLPENTASRRLLERAGFHFVGTAPGYLQIAGRWRDHMLYADLRADRTDPGRSIEDA